MSELINKYIEKDPVSFIHIKELLDRKYSIIYESLNGFIIHDDGADFTYISFSDQDEMKKELSKKRYYHYISYDLDVVKFYNDLANVKKLYQYVYPNKKLFDIQEYDIRVLSTDYSNFIDSFYKAIGPGETSYNALLKGEVLGLFVGGEMVGIIGRHPEGCIGMLHVFEQYRRKGYGEILEKAMINKLLMENQRVFFEVVEGNEISLRLQDKIGAIKGERTIYWLV